MKNTKGPNIILKPLIIFYFINQFIKYRRISTNKGLLKDANNREQRTATASYWELCLTSALIDHQFLHFQVWAVEPEAESQNSGGVWIDLGICD